jgi:hypothetical protein
MKETFEFINLNCVECGVVIFLPVEVHRIKLRDGNFFYCFNGHQQFFPKEVSPPPIPPTKIVKETLVIEKPYEPKNFREMLGAHEHNFSNKRDHPCVTCGLFKAAYEMLEEQRNSGESSPNKH